MASSTLAAKIPDLHHLNSMSQQDSTTELDAAQALLGVSPMHNNRNSDENPFLHPGDSEGCSGSLATSTVSLTATAQQESLSPASEDIVNNNSINDDMAEAVGESRVTRRPRSDSAGLDALAALAFDMEDTTSSANNVSSHQGHNSRNNNAAASSRGGGGNNAGSSNKPLAPFLVTSPSSSEGEDHPVASAATTTGTTNNNIADRNHSVNVAVASINDSMAPPSPARRRRSASNPEGMEKWDSYGDRQEGRRHFFVLPASILEVELAEASAAVQEKELYQSRRLGQYNSNNENDRNKTKKNARMISSIPEEAEMCCESLNSDDEDDESNGIDSSDKNNRSSNTDKEEEVDEKDLTPEELLRRARSRLLEDLSESNVNGEKGHVLLPHSLAKYKEVYNKNGRIGIYTPAERAAIISKFKGKRSRRVWNKKIRYNCRKNLADRRLRVKGRFVKRSEQEQLAKQLAAEKEAKDKEEKEQREREEAEKENSTQEDCDEEMLDIDDPEAGFVPTEDQPYRRLRRHTIT